MPRRELEKAKKLFGLIIRVVAGDDNGRNRKGRLRETIFEECCHRPRILAGLERRTRRIVPDAVCHHRGRCIRGPDSDAAATLAQADGHEPALHQAASTCGNTNPTVRTLAPIAPRLRKSFQIKFVRSPRDHAPRRRMGTRPFPGPPAGGGHAFACVCVRAHLLPARRTRRGAEASLPQGFSVYSLFAKQTPRGSPTSNLGVQTEGAARLVAKSAVARCHAGQPRPGPPMSRRRRAGRVRARDGGGLPPRRRPRGSRRGSSPCPPRSRGAAGSGRTRRLSRRQTTGRRPPRRRRAAWRTRAPVRRAPVRARAAWRAS